MTINSLSLYNTSSECNQQKNMKNIISAIVLVLAGLASAAPPFHHEHHRRGPYDISEFSASKGHNTGYCWYVLVLV